MFKINIIKRIISITLALSVAITGVYPPEYAHAQLPAVGARLNTSLQAYAPMIMKGLSLDPQEPLQFDFFMDVGDSGLDVNSQAFENESQKLIRYFLTALTIPEEDLWVNLSPVEPDRIMAPGFDQTMMGRDLLAQDYLLKQLSASLLHPDNEVGKQFWERVYAKAFELYGTTEVPVDTFHKVWIMPDRARLFQRENNIFTVENSLKVMLEQDYVVQNEKEIVSFPLKTSGDDTISTFIMRSIIIPEIQREVNEGAHFAPLRQIYSAMILATWYKRNLKKTLLAQVYADQEKIGDKIRRSSTRKPLSEGGRENSEVTVDQIYNQYLESVKEGVFDFIQAENKKEAVIPAQAGISIDSRLRGNDKVGSDGEVVRRYFAGGTTGYHRMKDFAMEADGRGVGNISARVTTQLKQEKRSNFFRDAALTTVPIDLTTEDFEWSGERSVKGLFNKELYRILEQTQPNVLNRLKKVITRFSDSDYSDGQWENWHDGVIGYNPQKRSVKIVLEQPIIYLDEVIDELHVLGVLFSRDDLNNQIEYEGLPGTRHSQYMVKKSFDDTGRLIMSYRTSVLAGSHRWEVAKKKYENSLRVYQEEKIRGPLMAGYMRFNDYVDIEGDEPLGVFVSAHRRDAPPRMLDMLHGLSLGELEKYYFAYGKALRKIPYIHPDLHFANIAIDITGKQKPIYYDFHELFFRDELTPAQAFAYRYNNFSSALKRVFEIQRAGLGIDQNFFADWIGVRAPQEEPLFKGFFYDRQEDNRLKIDLLRILKKHPVVPEEGAATFLSGYMVNIAGFVYRDNPLKNKRPAHPIHHVVEAPLLPLLWDVEQNDYPDQRMPKRPDGKEITDASISQWQQSKTVLDMRWRQDGKLVISSGVIDSTEYNALTFTAYGWGRSFKVPLDNIESVHVLDRAMQASPDRDKDLEDNFYDLEELILKRINNKAIHVNKIIRKAVTADKAMTTNSEEDEISTILKELESIDDRYIEIKIKLVSKLSTDLERVVKKDQGQNIVYYSHNNQQVVEILPQGSKRFFDENGRWILTIDFFGNPTDVLTWGDRGEFQRWEGKNINGKWFYMDIKEPGGNAQLLIRPLNLDQMMNNPELSMIHVAQVMSLLGVLDSGEFLEKAEYIPESHGAEGLAEWARGSGFVVLSALMQRARDRGNSPYYRGVYSFRYIRNSLMALAKPSRPIFEYEWTTADRDEIRKVEWTPYIIERIFNPNKLAIHVVNNRISRIYDEDRERHYYASDWDSLKNGTGYGILNFADQRAAIINKGVVLAIVDLKGNILEQNMSLSSFVDRYGHQGDFNHDGAMTTENKRIGLDSTLADLAHALLSPIKYIDPAYTNKKLFDNVIHDHGGTYTTLVKNFKKSLIRDGISDIDHDFNSSLLHFLYTQDILTKEAVAADMRRASAVTEKDKNEDSAMVSDPEEIKRALIDHFAMITENASKTPENPLKTSFFDPEKQFVNRLLSDLTNGFEALISRKKSYFLGLGAAALSWMSLEAQPHQDFYIDVDGPVSGLVDEAWLMNQMIHPPANNIDLLNQFTAEFGAPLDQMFIHELVGEEGFTLGYSLSSTLSRASLDQGARQVTSGDVLDYQIARMETAPVFDGADIETELWWQDRVFEVTLGDTPDAPRIIFLPRTHFGSPSFEVSAALFVKETPEERAAAIQEVLQKYPHDLEGYRRDRDLINTLVHNGQLHSMAIENTDAQVQLGYASNLYAEIAQQLDLENNLQYQELATEALFFQFWMEYILAFNGEIPSNIPLVNVDDQSGKDILDNFEPFVKLSQQTRNLVGEEYFWANLGPLDDFIDYQVTLNFYWTPSAEIKDQVMSYADNPDFRAYGRDWIDLHTNFNEGFRIRDRTMADKTVTLANSLGPNQTVVFRVGTYHGPGILRELRDVYGANIKIWSHENFMQQINAKERDGAMISQSGVAEPGWDPAIQRMFVSGLSFLPEKVRGDRFVYRGIQGNVIDYFLERAFTYQSNRSISTAEDSSESKLGVFHFSHFLSEAWREINLQASGENINDAVILVMRGSVFNDKMRQGKAAVHRNVQGQYRFPFVTEAPRLDELAYVLVDSATKQYLDRVKSGQSLGTLKEHQLHQALNAPQAPEIVELYSTEPFDDLFDWRDYYVNSGYGFHENDSVGTNIYPGSGKSPQQVDPIIHYAQTKFSEFDSVEEVQYHAASESGEASLFATVQTSSGLVYLHRLNVGSDAQAVKVMRTLDQEKLLHIAGTSRGGDYHRYLIYQDEEMEAPQFIIATKDAAMEARSIMGIIQENAEKPSQTGGIDLDGANLELLVDQAVQHAPESCQNTENPDLLTQKACFELYIDPAQLEQLRINAESFMPVIINVQPVTNLPHLLGLNTGRDEKDGGIAFNIFHDIFGITTKNGVS